jgi:hypothetical protein
MGWMDGVDGMDAKQPPKQTTGCKSDVVVSAGTRLCAGQGLYDCSAAIGRRAMKQGNQASERVIGTRPLQDGWIGCCSPRRVMDATLDLPMLQ